MTSESFFQTVELLQQVLRHEDNPFHVAVTKLQNAQTKEEAAIGCQNLHLALEPLLSGASVPSAPKSIGMWFAALGEAVRSLMISEPDFDQKQCIELNNVHKELHRLIHLKTWSDPWIREMWKGEWMSYMDHTTHNGHVKSVWDCPTGGLQTMHLIHIIGMCFYRYGRMNSEQFIENVICQLINRFPILNCSTTFRKALALITFGVAQHMDDNTTYSGFEYGDWCKSLRFKWSNHGVAFYPLLASLPIFRMQFSEVGRSLDYPEYDNIPGRFSSWASQRVDQRKSVHARVKDSV